MPACPRWTVSIPYGTIKRQASDDNGASAFVSIPYGTIKRCPWTRHFRKDAVSIPYGTIKSCPDQCADNIGAVSIPYGTIKSAGARRPGARAGGFQFHMVRLKATCPLLSQEVYEFQFHMVRLKGWTCSRRCSSTTVSIPYGTIKRRHSVMNAQFHSCFNSIWYD